MTARPVKKLEETTVVVDEVDERPADVDVEALREQIRAEVIAEMAQDTAPEDRPQRDPSAPRVIHILVDGFTAFAKVWYRGQEITVVPDSMEWKQTVDTQGVSWMDMSVRDQEIRYGRQMWGEGHWPHSGFDVDDPTLTDEEREILKRNDLRARSAAATPGKTQRK